MGATAMSAAGVIVSTAPIQGDGRGSTPTAALHDLEVRPIPLTLARTMVEKHHYLHSLPGGTRLAFGVFVESRLLGAITLGAGPFNAPSLVARATSDDYLTLTRLWLSDDLLPNSESRCIGTVLRLLRKHTSISFLLSYADPSQGHLGTIYQATNWLYIGMSEPMPLYDLGDGKARHSRSVSHAYGSHSVAHLRRHGVPVTLLPQTAKHRYLYFLNRSWQERLMVPVLPYPKKEVVNGGG
jgi:hypothetical protein